tara:strand:- start:1369 stop:2031 length:663 start_codon:yes stop_codon:yes gene_type:complete
MEESSTEEKKKWPKHKDHLNKSFLEAIGHQMWVTQGVRFAANERLLKKQLLSNRAIAILSAYLIILSLAQVYNLSITEFIDQNLVAFSVTALSILLLVFTQIESANDYKTSADLYLKCALEISQLHEELRIFQTMSEKKPIQKESFVKDMSLRYNKVLSYYPNHLPIDYDKFRSQHLAYFSKDENFKRYINLKYFWETKWLYLILVYLPPVIIISVMIWA